MHQSEPRQEQQREGEGPDQRARVVDPESACDELVEFVLGAQNADEKRKLEAHQGSHHQHGQVQDGVEGGGEAEGVKQPRRGQSAHQSRGELHVHEGRAQPAGDVPGEVGAEAQGEEVDPDHGGELRDRVAQHVARDRAHDELVDQPGGRDQEHHGEQGRGRHASTPTRVGTRKPCARRSATRRWRRR